MIRNVSNLKTENLSKIDKHIFLQDVILYGDQDIQQIKKDY